MKYQINGFHKTSTLDNWEHGCAMAGNDSYIDWRVAADSLPELVKKVQDCLTVKLVPEPVGDELNRLDFQSMENALGFEASKAEMEEFKRGEIDLYLCDYTCYVEMVQDADCSSLFSVQSAKGE